MRAEQVRLQSALKGINEHVGDALEAIGDLSIEQFAANKEKVAAVAYHGVVIGEAANRALSAAYNIEDSDLVARLQRARLARNEFVHEYDVLEADNLYVTVTNLYAPLRERVRIYLGMPSSKTKDDEGAGWTR